MISANASYRVHNKLAELEESGESVYEGDLDLYGYKYSLPQNLKQVHGSLRLLGYAHPLPLGLESVSGNLTLTDLGSESETYAHPLPPRLRHIGGSLELYGYKHPLPSGLKRLGGYVNLFGYKHKLPAGIESLGGNLVLTGYDDPLPARLKSIEGSLRLDEYDHPLPAGLTNVGGYLSLGHYRHSLPAGLTNVGGELSLGHYHHPLPAGLTSVGGTIRGLKDYNRPLPAGLTSVGSLFLEGYKQPLPAGLKVVRGSLYLWGYDYPLPARLKIVGGPLDVGEYKHPLPPGLGVVGEVLNADEYEFSLPSEVSGEHYEITAPQATQFRSWFEGSRAVTPDGKPAIVYHGTEKGGFSAFDSTKIDPHHPGFYFADDLRVSSSYIESAKIPLQDPTPKMGDPDGNDVAGVYRLFLSLKNPAVIDCQGSRWNRISHPDFPGLSATYEIAAEAKRRGYDGVIFKDLKDHGGRSGVERTGTVYVAFEPTQIKSALFNQGTYDPKDPDIRKNPRRRTSRPGKSRRKTSRGKRKTSRS